MKKRLGWMQRDEIDEIANDLGVSSEEVMQMEQRLNAADVSLHIDEQDDHEHHHFIRQLEMPDSDPAQFVAAVDEAEHTKEKLQYALASLDARSQDILYHRWLNEDASMTLQDLADKYQVSAERIRQLEKNAMLKLKKIMQA